MSVKKRILEVTIFLLVMFLTFYTLFSGKNLGEIANAVSKMSVGYLVPAAALAIFFVCAEGYMIWYLLQAMKANRRKEGSSLIRCIQYSFIGFFYSGITPSATGGQPVQLYYMSKDGNRGSDSTVVLMTVAVVYKFVLVILGAAILLFWYRPLYSELGKFFPLYLFGLLLNVMVSMIYQNIATGLAIGGKVAITLIITFIIYIVNLVLMLKVKAGNGVLILISAVFGLVLCNGILI